MGNAVHTTKPRSARQTSTTSNYSDYASRDAEGCNPNTGVCAVVLKAEQRDGSKQQSQRQRRKEETGVAASPDATAPVSPLPLTVAATSPEVFTSGQEQVHLLELFTSEGCSSCPPSEAWLVAQRRSRQLWQRFVPVAFHVDYWDYLGWPDRLASAAFTKRERAYAHEWQSQSVYTPCFALDGREWRRSQSQGRGDWESKLPSVSSAGQLTVRRTASAAALRFAVNFTPDKNNNHHPSSSSTAYYVHGALLGNGIVHKVTRGENAGATLQHEFVALSLTSSPLLLNTSSSDALSATIELGPSSTQRRQIQAQSYSVAFWVTAGESQTPLQATGGDIAL